MDRLELAKNLMFMGQKLKTASRKEADKIYDDAIALIKKYEADLVLEE